MIKPYSKADFNKLSVQKCIILFIPVLFSLSLSAQPSISSFSPVTGPVGTSVTITGTNFSTTPANNIVFFGAVKANVTTALANSLTVTVPVGSTYQPITITTGGLTGYSARPFLVTFTGGGQINSTSFGVWQDFATDIRPNAVTLSDFDGDGKTDVATPNNHNNAGVASVSVLRNTSNGGNIAFAPKQDYVTGTITYGITSGDIDGDGKPDIVSVSIGATAMSVFRNTSSAGTITFAPKIDITTGSSPVAVAIGDVDNDGKADVVTLNSTSQTISVFRNTGTTGTISFAPKVDFSTQLSPESLVLADLDGDGKMDIAFTNELSNSFSVYRNTSTSGTISLATRIDYNCGSGNQPYGMALGDLDNDAKTDLIVVINNTTGGGAQLFRNTGSGGTISFTFSTSVSSGAASNTNYHAGITDINGDGKLDIALTVAGSSSGQSQVYQNNTTGSTFSFGTTNNFFSSFAPYGIVLGDMEGDGKPDLIISEFTGEKVSVYKNRCGAPNIISFTPASALSGATITISGNNFTGTTAVSFGGTPALSFTVVNSTTITAVVGTGASGDVMVTNSFGSGSMLGFVFIAPPVITSFLPLNAGTGQTVTITGSNFIGTTGVSFGGIAAAPFSVINSSTITAVVGSGATGNISVTNSFGTGSLVGFFYQPPPAITSFTPVSGGQGTSVIITGTNFNNVQSVSIGAVSATSYVVNSATSITAIVDEGATGSIGVATLWGEAISAGIFSFPYPTILSFSPASGIVGSTVVITGTNFRSTAVGNHVYFGATKAVVTSASPTSLSVTVPSGSTYQPISVSVNNHTAMSNQVFKTTYPDAGAAITNRSFGWVGGFAVENGPWRVVLADMDGDGKSDIITGNFTSRTVSITRNTSTGGTTSFSAPFQLASGLGTQIIISTGDLNSDGKLDIAFTGNQNQVSVLLNTSVPGTISFAARINFISLDVCRGIALGDFDGDAKTDIAVSTGSIFSSGHFISVFRNTGFNGAINFAARIDIAVTGTPHDIKAADMDKDNKTDIVLGAETYMGVIRNTSVPGTLSFASLQTYGSGGYYTQLATGDIDGDNQTDVVAVNYPSANISVFRNISIPGTITLSSPITITGISSTSFLRLGQLDGDGKPDIIVMPTNDKKWYVKKNLSTVGSISFDTNIEFAITQLMDNWVGDVAIGDLEGDDKDDVAVTNTTDNKVSVFRNRNGFPTISSFTPATVGTGGTVQINGYNFTAITAVRFGGVPASSFLVLNSTTISATVGAGASGYVFVGNSIGSDSLQGFIFLAPPSINSFTPTSAANGTVITITGSNFTGTTAISFGGIAAISFTIVNSTTITAVVGTGASGSISVTTPGGTATRTGFIFISTPTITSFTPTNAVTGATVTITGTNFTGATAVTFGGVAAQSFNVNSATSITAVVGTGASGNVSVTTPGGTAILTGFTYNIVTSVSGVNNNNSKELTINPNPANDIIVVKHPGSLKNAFLKVIDINGKTIKVLAVGRNITQTSFSVKGMAAGIYKILWADGKKLLRRTLMIRQ